MPSIVAHDEKRQAFPDVGLASKDPAEVSKAPGKINGHRSGIHQGDKPR